AKALTPRAWTWRDVERALHGDGIDGADRAYGFADAEAVARVSLALARVPADALAIEAIERDANAPGALVTAAADALRLAGESGRARALALRPVVRDLDGGD